MATIDLKKEEYEFISSFYSANLGINVKEVVGPAFPTSFLSTQWLFVLHLQNNITCISLRRANDCGPDKPVHVILTERSFKNVWKVKQTNRLPCSFKKGDTIEILKVKNYCKNTTTILRIVTNPKRDVMTVSCKLVPDIQKYDHMYELSRNMCFLFTNPKFSDALLCVGEEERKVHRAILSVRTPNLQLCGKRDVDSNTVKVKLRALSGSMIEQISKFAYCAQMDTDLTYVEDRVLNRVAKHLGMDNFEENWRDISYLKSVTNLKFKRSYINLICDYNKSPKRLENQEYDFVAFRTHWKIHCSFSKADNEEIAAIKVSCDRVGSFETLIMRYFKFVTCSCLKMITRNIIYRNVLESEEKFLLTDENKTTFSITCCSIRHYHFFIDFWSGKTDDLVEQGQPKYTRDTLSDILNLSEDLQKLFDEGNYTDSVIRLPDGELKTHRAILSVRSPVFDRMFDNDMRESTEREIHIVDFEKNVIEKLLRYIYTARVVFAQNAETIQLAYAADKYDAIPLKFMCLSHLSTNIDKDTALDIYTLFDRLHAGDELKNRVVKYIQGYFCAVCDKEILEGWKQLNPEPYFSTFKRTCTCKKP